jgi:hypothetical protein
MEIIVAAMVLGILYMGVSNLQKGNREALLRIRGRDGAITVAQNVIDNLGATGLANFSDDRLLKNNDNGKLYVTDFPPVGTKVNDTTLQVTRTWLGLPGIIQNTMKVDYFVVVSVTPDTTYDAKTISLYRPDTIFHTFAKSLDVKVGWKFKGADQSITVSGVIR